MHAALYVLAAFLATGIIVGLSLALDYYVRRSRLAARELDAQRERTILDSTEKPTSDLRSLKGDKVANRAVRQLVFTSETYRPGDELEYGVIPRLPMVRPDGSTLRETPVVRSFYVSSMLDGMYALIELMREFDMDCWVQAGLLIGHLRHGGPLPWDDDVDLFTQFSNKHTLWSDEFRQAARARGLEMFVRTENTEARADSRALIHFRTEGQPLAPVLDLFFMTENARGEVGRLRMWNDDDGGSFAYTHREVWPLDVIYPLREVEFIEGRPPITVPNDPEQCVKLQYGDDVLERMVVGHTHSGIYYGNHLVRLPDAFRTIN